MNLIPLLFQNPAFPSPGNSFTTVRIGDKWLKPAIGSPLELRNVDEKGEDFPVGRATLLGRFEGSLDSIPSSLLAIEHDPKCRTHLGLVNVLTEVYGADAVSFALAGDREFVTLLVKVEDLA